MVSGYGGAKCDSAVRWDAAFEVLSHSYDLYFFFSVEP